jgi:TRAP-type C4-dicarboxylate transport system permease small subunit
MDMRSSVERIVDAVNSALVFIAGVALVILIAIFGWLVYGRYILNSTPTWVEQASLLIIVVITFFGAAIGIRERTHLSVEFFRDMFPPRGQLVLFTVGDLLLMIFGGLMAYHGYGLAMFNVDKNIPLLNISEAWKSAPLALGGLLICLFSTYHMIGRLLGHRDESRPQSAENLGAE